MKISVLTPAYNAAKYIDQLMASVEQQDYQNYEHIVLDDGSTDDTADRVRQYPKTTVISRENRGQFATLNELLRLISGDSFIVICADDYFADNTVFATAARKLASSSKPDIVVGRTPRWMDRDRPYRVNPDVPLSIGIRTVHQCLAVQHCSMFVRTDFQRKHSVYFSEDYSMCGDWDWMSRLWAAGPRVKAVGRNFGVWRQHPEQKSARYAQIAAEERLRVLSNHRVSSHSHNLLRNTFGLYSKAAHAAALISTFGPTALLHSVTK